MSMDVSILTYFFFLITIIFSPQVPNYHKIIATPMDLGTVKAKLTRTHAPRYITIDDFLGDIQLIFSNCAVFNDVSCLPGAP